MKIIEKRLRTFAADEAQDISYGIWESAISLADGLADGSISEEEAVSQLADLRSALEEAKAE